MAAPTPMFHTAGAEKALAGSGAYSRSDSVISVAEKRTVCLQLAYDAAAAGGYPLIFPQVSFSEETPAADDDSWQFLPAVDGIVTPTTISGAAPSGADYTLAPQAGVMVARPLAVQPMGAATAGTNEIRQTVGISLDGVPGARWFQFIVAEVGATGSPGSLLVTATAA